MLRGVYQENGIFRNHRRTEPPRDIESAGLIPTIRWRDRASAWYDAADRIEAPAGAARGRFRGVHRGRTTPSLPAQTWTISGGGCLAGAVPPVLVGARGCSRTAPRPDGTVDTNEGNISEKEGNEKSPRRKPRT